MAKDQPFVDFDAGKEWLAFAKDQVKPPFAVEAFEHVKDVEVGRMNVGEGPIFEQFVPVADFDVSDLCYWVVNRAERDANKWLRVCKRNYL